MCLEIDAIDERDCFGVSLDLHVDAVNAQDAAEASAIGFREELILWECGEFPLDAVRDRADGRLMLPGERPYRAARKVLRPEGRRIPAPVD